MRDRKQSDDDRGPRPIPGRPNDQYLTCDLDVDVGLGDIFERIRAQYVEDVDEEELIEAAINGMLTSLDPHSSYLSPRDAADMRVQTRGEFGGLGIEVTQEEGFVKVVSPIDDTPAKRAGVQSGDLIIRLDDQPVKGMSLDDAVKKMRGKPHND